MRTRICCLLSLMLLLGACGSRDKGQSLAVADDYGREISVPLSPSRVVSTSPAVTEIVFALGAGELLVGRTDFCTYPPQAAHIESIGGISNLNIEKVVSLKPDLVISGSMVPRRGTELLDKMGIPVVCIIEKHTFDDLYGNIARIGQLVGRTHQADSLIALIRSQLADLVADTLPATDTLPTLYYVVGFGSGGNYTAGGSSHINEILQLAGGRNIAEDITGWSYSLEALLAADPDYVVIRREDSARFCHTRPYNRLCAVRSHRVIAIESGTIDIQGPRNLQAVKTIRHALCRRP